MPTATSGASRRGEEPPDQRQTGLCSMQRPVILSPGLPPDLPDGFIRQPYRPSDRPALPTALPEALAGRVTWVILTGWFYTPDLPAGFVPATRPASLTSSPTGSLTGSLTGQPHQPAQPTSPTDQPDRPAQPTSPTDQPNRPARPAASPANHTSQPDQPARPAASPTSQTGQPHQPSTPAKVPPACLTGRLRSAGRRLRGWRSSRHG